MRITFVCNFFLIGIVVNWFQGGNEGEGSICEAWLPHFREKCWQLVNKKYSVLFSSNFLGELALFIGKLKQWKRYLVMTFFLRICIISIDPKVKSFAFYNVYNLNR